MLDYLITILGLGALCAVWVVLQRWFGKLDPEPEEKQTESRCGGCSGCNTNNR